MSHADELIHRLGSVARSMEGVMPTEREPVQLHIGEISLLIDALILLTAVRRATSHK